MIIKSNKTRRRLAIVGLVLSVMTAMLWVHSFFMLFQYGARTWLFATGHGLIGFVKFDPAVLPEGWVYKAISPIRFLPSQWWPTTWFYSGPRANLVIIFPYWLPFCLVAVPTAWLWLTSRKPQPGHCRNCSYNLTGNTTGTCPECGTPTAQSK